ncbi:MAG TPA: HEAT repeat domain-containing protein [Trueperaceae bacterium]
MSETWTPERGTRELVARYGREGAFAHLTRLLAGEVPPAHFTTEPTRTVLRLIGRTEPQTFLAPDREMNYYWPRSWAARALAYLGDEDATPWLLTALHDPHWRVRMTAAQTLGRLGIPGIEDELAGALIDPHQRVRAAAATALGRTGNEFAIEPLQRALEDQAETVRTQADRALAQVERRIAE